ncbi:MAG: hypothetical protein L6R38_005761 [Xanthoria sp. 2 TBL-2021]|nr:MAG: hypothetical protein L6R38_005761 [Xanthoria sp. 2 TBL-2021]
MADQSESSSLVPNVTLRHSYERPRTADTPPSQALPSAIVNIKHPGYEQSNLLMRFNAYDRFEQQEGIHHGTILTACYVVSGCNDGFLTKERGGTGLGLDINGLLGEGSYYFVVPGDEHYAIYPSFQYWSFPHGHLPPGWNNLHPRRKASGPAPARSNTTSVVLARDQECLVSGHQDIMERAHLCPQKETTWFRTNDMDQYNQSYRLSPECTTDDMSNLIALREDIHTAFDRHCMFVFVAKQDKWLIHFLEPSNNLGPQYHNVNARLNDGVASEHVLARFAWAIFPMVRPFLGRGPKRWVRALVTDEDGSRVEEKAFMDLATITQRFFPPRTRSQSPKKRVRTDDDIADDSQEREAGQGVRKRRKFMQTSELHHEGASDIPRSRSDATSLSALSASKHPSTSTLTATSKPVPSIPPTKDVKLPSKYHDNGIDDPDPRVHHLYSDESRLDRLRRLELKRRRPYHNPDLFCCDYDKRTAAVYAAIKGEGDWDAYQLCDECLGGEYLPREADLDEKEDTHE